MIGFETIGNATLICHDEAPILATDPWLSDTAYFGSWTLAHAVPAEQLANVFACKYIWLSHGHPDHLDAASLHQLCDKTILLPDHVGQRIYDGLLASGYDVHIVKDGEWLELSKHIRVMCLADYNQDATLLVDINGRLIVNFNDAKARGWEKVVRHVISQYDVSFMLKLFGYGDADMINIFGEDGSRLLKDLAIKYPVGEEIQNVAELYGVRYVIPFSSFHAYQRTDSAWANEYTTPLSTFADGFAAKHVELLPAFVQYDCINDRLEEIRPQSKEMVLYGPEVFGDRWSDALDKSEVDKLKRYFMQIESMHDHFDFIRFRVGGSDYTIELRKGRFKRGLTFEAPRASLMTAVDYEIFDDMLIGNFMKTTLHGDASLYPYFTPCVAKYADNGRAKTKEELRDYMSAYRQRAPLTSFVMHRLMHNLEVQSKSRIRAFMSNRFDRDAWVYQTAKRTYYLMKGIIE